MNNNLRQALATEALYLAMNALCDIPLVRVLDVEMDEIERQVGPISQTDDQKFVKVTVSFPDLGMKMETTFVLIERVADVALPRGLDFLATDEFLPMETSEYVAKYWQLFEMRYAIRLSLENDLQAIVVLNDAMIFDLLNRLTEPTVSLLHLAQRIPLQEKLALGKWHVCP